MKGNLGYLSEYNERDGGKGTLTGEDGDSPLVKEVRVRGQ